MPDEPRYRAWMTKMLKYGAHVWVLALDDDKIVGFFEYCLDHNFSEKPVAVMGSFFVAKAHRRSAVPAILFDLGVGQAQADGACAFHAPITSETQSSRALENMFRHHGFTVIGSMMGKGTLGGHYGRQKSSDNGAMIKEQKAQATEARQKEVDRQTRLQQGLANIRAAFEGGQMKQYGGGAYTVPGAVAGASSGGAVAGLPAGYTYYQEPGKAAAQPRRPSSTGGGGREQAGFTQAPVLALAADQGNQYSWNQPKHATATGGTPAGPMMIRGPDGRLYKPGEQLRLQHRTRTPEPARGFGDDFYNRFKQGMLDYFTPQVAQQYGEAKDELTYRLARAGTGRSSVAIDEAAKLAEQNRLNQADVVAKADTGAADLQDPRRRANGPRRRASSTPPRTRRGGQPGAGGGHATSRWSSRTCRRSARSSRSG